MGSELPPGFVLDKPAASSNGGALPPGYTIDPPPARTWWDTAKSAGQTADDAVRAAANVLSFGMADRLAGLTEGGTAAAVKRSEAARERSPYASVAGDVAGAVALPGLGGARVANALGNTFRARAAGYGLEGAAVGAGQGAGTTYSGVPSDYVHNALTGGAIGGAAGGLLGGILGPRTGPRSTAEVPSTDRLYREKTANYQDLENSPALYEAGALARAATPTEDVLRAQRFHPNDSPRSFQAIEEMRAPPTTAHLGIGAPVSPGDIEYIRKGLNQINPVTGATDKASASYVKRALDNFVRNPPPGAVMPGTEAAAAEATALANRARGNYGGYKRGEFFDDMMDNAITSAGAANSGLNLQNRLRQVASSAVRRNKGESPASRAGYNDEEIAALTRFARVPAGDATLRYIDRLAGGGGGLGATVAGGIGGGVAGQYLKDNPAAGAAVGVGIPALGLTLRSIGNRRATANMNELSDMVRRRTPLYQERLATAPMTDPGKHGSQMLRDAITAGLVGQGFGQVDSVEDEPLRITVNPRR